jgi:YVTN family beta-propeller protein
VRSWSVSPDGKRLYVANGRVGTVSDVNLETNQVRRNVLVGKRPWGIALSPDGTKLYTANGPSNDISVVDVATFTVVKTIPAGKSPWGVVVR